MFVTMHIRAFVGWMFITAVLSLVIGGVSGGAYVTHQADAVIATAQTRYDSLKKDFDGIMTLNAQLQDALRRQNANVGNLLDRVGKDESVLGDYVSDAQATAGESTVIYERSPELQVRFTGIRGLPVLPLPGNGQQLPRVLIPGHVRPMILAPDGDARQAVFFYLDKRNRMRGPYVPVVVRPQ